MRPNAYIRIYKQVPTGNKWFNKYKGEVEHEEVEIIGRGKKRIYSSSNSCCEIFDTYLVERKNRDLEEFYKEDVVLLIKNDEIVNNEIRD